MAFDGIVTKAIVTELQEIIGSKIDKIHEPDRNTIVLGLYSNGKNYALNICIDSHNCRINLTTHQKENPLVAPNFCMLLRKHLLGGRISNISMLGLERLVKIEIETINEFNEIEEKTLIVELMGKHSNIILINQAEKIIDAMRRIDSKNSYREILPSRIYLLPKSEKADLLKIKDFNEFEEKIQSIIGDNSSEEICIEDVGKAIANTFTGISYTFAKSAIQGRNLQEAYQYICKIIEAKEKLEFEFIYKGEKASDYVLKFREFGAEDEITQFCLNCFIDDFYYERETSENFKNYRNTILRLIFEALKKYNKRLENINIKLKECDDMDKYRLYGELITTNLYRLPNNHSESIEVENYYENNKKITIPMDVRYTPNINAKRYFKKYAKLKNAFEIVTKQKVETEKELNYIESIIYELENSSCIEDVQDIFEEIKENVAFKERLKKKENKKKKASKKKKQQNFAPIEYEVEGYKVYVGRNNKENDWLTLSFANKTDIWFHTKDIHGSHVILRAGNNVSNEVLVKCAEIAAKHSKAKDSSNVPVDYCKVQYVKKPNGAKPGMVIFTNNKTLNVKPLSK